MDTGPTTAAARTEFCAACGAPLTPGARFCHRCGTAAGSAAAPVRHGGQSVALPWGVAALALVALVSLLAGQYVGRGAAANATAPTAGAPRAPDISSMSPDERADRLFLRVMEYVGDGKLDSAQFFLPMAIGALEAVSPRTIHHRYDLGLLGLVTGDGTTASAQADTILREQSTHLLGLMLAASAADARADTAARARYQRQLLEAEARERARQLPEYAVHAGDIDAAIARARRPR